MKFQKVVRDRRVASHYDAAAVMVQIQFFSYFRELTGVQQLTREVADGCSLGDLYDQICAEHPPLLEMSRSTLMAVGTDYQTRDHVLKEGDVVSLFPPVQGG